MGGDPHIRTFDQTRGWSYHPVFAPGTWWLVHTESGEFQSQATYSQCGRRTGGGWQGWKKHHNTSAHCLDSVAFGGSILDNKALTIQPPCAWNWGDIKCDSCTADKMPRVMFNGQRVTLVKDKVIEVLGTKLTVQCRANRCAVKVDGDRVALLLTFHGGAGFEPSRTKTCNAGTYGTMHMWMNQGDFGKQCGHCGSFDGNAGGDKVYGQDGSLNKDASPLCAAEVTDCHQIFQATQIPTQFNSNGAIIPQDETLCGCNDGDNVCAKDDQRRDVVKLCANSYKEVCNSAAPDPADDAHKPFFEECVEDVCLGGTAFTETDVEDGPDADCSETESMNDDAVCKHCE